MSLVNEMNIDKGRKNDKDLAFKLGKACIATNWAKNPEWRQILQYLTEELDVSPRTLIKTQKKVKEYLEKETKEYAGDFDFKEYFTHIKPDTRQFAPPTSTPPKARSAPPASDTRSIAPPSTGPHSQSDSMQEAPSPTSINGDLSEAGSQFKESDTSSSKNAPVFRGGIDNISPDTKASRAPFHFLSRLLMCLRTTSTKLVTGPIVVRHGVLASVQKVIILKTGYLCG
jgi:hypothetical protein